MPWAYERMIGYFMVLRQSQVGWRQFNCGMALQNRGGAYVYRRRASILFSPVLSTDVSDIHLLGVCGGEGGSIHCRSDAD